MVLKYSVNAAMSVFFKTGKSKSTESIDVKKLYEDIPQMIIPQIDIIVNNEDSKDVFDGTDLSKPIDLNKLHNIVEHYGEIYLTNDDKLKRDLQCDHWFESNFAFGVSFILSLIGTIGMQIAIATCIKSHKATALMAAFWKADTTEGRIIDHSVTDDFS